VARSFLIIAAGSGFLSVALGAFGAHALRGRLDGYAQSVFDTAVQYHFVHTLALLAVALLCRDTVSPSRWLTVSGAAFTVGLLIFCGSLYLLSVTGQRWLGAITPLGGLAFLVGWAALLFWGVGAARVS
jgi:uncharacterized membrane protein YgdD (TMEM256/DUF423 family)